MPSFASISRGRMTPTELPIWVNFNACMVGPSWLDGGYNTRYTALQDKPAQVARLRQRSHLFGHVGGIDNEGLATAVGRGEADILQQPLQYRVQPPRADVLHAIVDVRGKVSQCVHRVVTEVQRHALGSQQRRVLLQQGVLGLGQDPPQVIT